MGHARRGITLIEASIVVVICAIIAATAVPSMRDLMDRQSLRGSADELHSDLLFLRSASLARGQDLFLATRADSTGSCYVIHTGMSGGCACDGTAASTCTAGSSSVKSVGFAVNGAVQVRLNVAELHFMVQSRTVTPAGTLTLTSRAGASVDEVVSALGRVKTCSPNGSMSGYKPC